MVGELNESHLLRWIPLLPLLAAAVHGVLLGVVRRSLPRGLVILLSCGAVVVSFLLIMLSCAFSLISRRACMVPCRARILTYKLPPASGTTYCVRAIDDGLAPIFGPVPMQLFQRFSQVIPA